MSEGKSDDSPVSSRDETEGSSFEGGESANFELLEPQLMISKDDEDEGSSSPRLTSTWTERNSFTADSPYFKAFCDSEVNSLSLLTDTMRDITSRTRTFAKTGILMSEATRRLAMSCKLRQDSYEETENPVSVQERMAAQRRKAIGDEMTALLGQLGEVSFIKRDPVYGILPKSWGLLLEHLISALPNFRVGAGEYGGSPERHGPVH